jgi:GT2 family glycosyltransferase
MLSIIVVAYNCPEHIRTLISSANEHFGTPGNSYEIIVVDNSADSFTLDVCKVSRIRYFPRGDNPGFSVACNVGRNYARGEWLLFINPDCVVDKVDVDFLSNCDNKDVYIPYIKELQGSDTEYSGFMGTFPFLFNYIKRYLGFSVEKNVWWRGSAILIHKSLLDSIGGWDENFFMYAEDLDLFYRLRQNKVKTSRVPIYLTHKGGGVTSKVWSDFEREIRVQKSTLYFYKKNNAWFSLIFFYPCLLIASLFKNRTKGLNSLLAYLYVLFR